MKKSGSLGKVALTAGLALLVAKQAWAQSEDTAAGNAPAADQSSSDSGTTSPTADPNPADKAATPDATAQATQPAEGDGLFGPFRVGPTMQVGIPYLVNYGIDATYAKTFGFGISFGGMEREQDLDDVKVKGKLSNWDLRARWHPFQGSFFLGASYGSMEVSASGEMEMEFAVTGAGKQKAPVVFDASISRNYFTPHLGWFATWDVGFTLGFELGYQMPVSPESSFDFDVKGLSAAVAAQAKSSDEYKKSQKDIKDALQIFGETGLPHLTLLRIGWLF